MGVVVSSSHVVSAAPSSSRSSCAPAWGLSHRSQSSMNFSNVGPSHGLQFLTNCSSVGAFHRVQSFRNRLLQCGSPTGSQVLPANLLQPGLSTESQPPSGIHLLWRAILHGLQVDICSTMDLHGLQWDSLPHYGLLHGLEGNLCSGTWSISSSSFFTDLGVCRVVCLTYSLFYPFAVFSPSLICYPRGATSVVGPSWSRLALTLLDVGETSSIVSQKSPL